MFFVFPHQPQDAFELSLARRWPKLLRLGKVNGIRLMWLDSGFFGVSSRRSCPVRLVVYHLSKGFMDGYPGLQ